MSGFARPVIGIAGWKGSGKTTLVVALVEALSRKGYRVATIKHTHHLLRLDDDDTDSARHRRAGACQSAVAGPDHWAIAGGSIGEGEAMLDDMLTRLGPCDVVLVEGYKSAAIPKIETRRAGQSDQRDLAVGDTYFVAIAADYPVDGGALPVFRLNDIEVIGSFVEQTLELSRAT